jgi:cellulose synthase/poly-beta-1,6-N-acetylglucosamine synthase-like glycosyltransferase
VQVFSRQLGPDRRMTSPRVSVVLSVRNGAADLPKAIDTILTQTFTDFELIAINNGSSDGTATVLDRMRDPRLRVFHQDDMGLAAALNRGIALARGQYIARQDHDDWAKPTRLEKQVAFLDANPDCALVGTRAEIWVGDRKTMRVHDHPTGNAALQFELLFDNPFVHSSILLRKSALDVVGGYSVDPARQPPEDYELWSRIARRFRVANLPERLTIYREVPNSMSRERSASFVDKIVAISAENLAAAAGAAPPDTVHWDIAALSQRAFGRVSSDPDVEGMCRTIRDVAGRILLNNSNPDAATRVTQRIDSLRHAFALYRRGVHPSWQAYVALNVAITQRLRRKLASLYAQYVGGGPGPGGRGA